MTKEQAIIAMKKGLKLTHSTFTPDEWVTMRGDKIKTEDGYKISASLFWWDRRHKKFETGWTYFN